MLLLPKNLTRTLPGWGSSVFDAAVDLGDHSAKVVLGAKRGARMEVTAAVRVPLPSDQEAGLQGRVAALAENLREWCGVAVNPLRCSLPASLTDYESAELPSDLKDVEPIALDVIRQLHGDLDEVTWDYWRTSGELLGGRHDALHLVWASNQDIGPVLAEFKRAGLACAALDSAPTALPAVVPDDERLRLIVDLGHNAAEFVVAWGSQTVYARRRVAVGAAALTDQLAESLGVQRTSAETLLEDWGQLVDANCPSAMVAKRCEDWLQKLQFELQRTLAYLDNRITHTDLTEIVFTGGGAAVRGMAQWVEQRLGTPSSPAGVPAHVDWRAATPYSPVFAQALALLPKEGEA